MHEDTRLCIRPRTIQTSRCPSDAVRVFPGNHKGGSLYLLDLQVHLTRLQEFEDITTSSRARVSSVDEKQDDKTSDEAKEGDDQQLCGSQGHSCR